jgi:hypothetical protein
LTLPIAEVESSPPITRTRTATTFWVVWWAIVFVVVVGALVVNRNFWFDEGMAYQAIAQQGFLAPGQPLLHYEQSMPYGVYVVYKLLVGSVGLNEDVLRLPGLAVYLVGLVALARTTRQIEGTIGRFAALAAGGLAMWVVFESAMFKHYIFEYAAGALILATGWSLLQSRFRGRNLVAFTAVSIVSLLFSNTAPFMTGAVLVTVVVVVLIDDRAALRRRLVAVVAAAVLYLVVFGALYVTVIKPANVYQLGLPFYGGAGLGSLAHALTTLWAPTGKPIFALLGVAVFVVIAVGLVLTLRRGAAALFPYLVLLIALVAMVLGAKTGLSPFSNPRHVLFSAPAIGLAFGAATQAIARVIGPMLSRAVALRAAAVVVVGVVGIAFVGIGLFGTTKKQEEVGRILSANRAACGTTYVEYTFQPAAEMYDARDHLGIRLEGLVDSRSGLGHDSWLSKVTDHLTAYDARASAFFEANGPACLLAMPVRAQDPLLKALSTAGVDCTAIDRKTGIGLYRCES